MTYLRSFGGALAAGLVAAVGVAGPALAEPPDDWAPTPPGPPSPPVLTMSTPEVVEGTGGANEMVFEFTLNKPASGGESFRFYTQDAQGSALPVEDHEPMLEFPSFDAGDTSLTVGIPLVTDDVPEANEHILVAMDQPTGLTILDEDGTGVIIDDDIPTLSIADLSQDEGTGGTTTFHVTVALSEPSTVDVYVEATPVAGTAGTPADWTGFSQLVQFAPGDTAEDVEISVVADRTPERDEKLTVSLAEADYATIADASARVTIVNDDALKATTATTAPPPTTADDLTTPTPTPSTTRVASLDATLAATDERPPLDLRPAASVVLALLGGVLLLTAYRTFN